MDKDNTQLVERLHALQDQSSHLSEENAFFRKKFAQVQHEFQLARNQFSRQEQQLFNREQEVEELQQEIQALTRKNRDLQKEISHEVESHEHHQELWHEKELQFQEQFRSLQDQLIRAGQEIDFATAEACAAKATSDVNSPLVEESLRYLREARLAQRQVKEQERLMYTLTQELDKLKKASGEMGEEAKKQQLKIAYLENEAVQLRRVNGGLVEDIDSYNMLLQEKTLNGEFALSPILQRDVVSEKRKNLAAELNRAFSGSVSPRSSIISLGPQDDVIPREKHLDEEVAKLSVDVKSLREENKALQLYISKILARIIEQNQMHVLANDTDYSKHSRSSSAATAVHTVTHRKTPSNVSIVKEEDVSGRKPWRRAQSMIVPKAAGEALATAIENKEISMASAAEEEGMLRKAFKRMSMVAWKTPVVVEEKVEKTQQDKNESAITKSGITVDATAPLQKVEEEEEAEVLEEKEAVAVA